MNGDINPPLSPRFFAAAQPAPATIRVIHGAGRGDWRRGYTIAIGGPREGVDA
jgi:hypothetical protein